MTPKTQYAQSGELSIAYQCVGDGPLDLLFIPGFVSNVELSWDIPLWVRLFGGLSALGRLVFFDKRGTGCSDRTLGTGSAEDRMDDVRAVADAAGIDQAVVIGLSEGGPLAILFATAFPERVRSLVLWGTFARCLKGPDYEIGLDPELVEAFIADIRDQWGTGHALEAFVGGVEEEMQDVLARYEHQTASPGAAATILHHNVNMDVRYALGAVGVPTLVVHRTRDPVVPVRLGRYLADHITGARFVDIPGDFHVGGQPGDDDPVLDAIAEFVTGAPAPRPRRYRPSAHDSALYRHRWFHRPCLRDRRSSLANAARTA